jgi:anaerobic ribonucleoside-triphosphate reductase activating protein
MNYHNITKCDILNGEGVRVVLWLAGCSHHCKGCQNPITWDKNGGLLFDEKAKEELFEALGDDDIDGITFSGGDPLFCDNREEVGKLIEEIATKFPQKNIWLYTGYLWEEIKDLPFIKYVDVIVDGEFQIDKLDNSLLWKGSSNQRVIDVKYSLKTGECILHCQNIKSTLTEIEKCKNCC